MITLTTGAPGTGKSAYTLSLMIQLLSEGRPLFVHGVPGLAIPHTAVSCESPSCEHCASIDWSVLYRMPSAENWQEWAPQGAVLFFDEVQNIYRPRSSGAKVPASVAAFETHRHKGLDFFLVSQHPRLIDANVRQLIGRHVHLVLSWKGRTMFDWPECSDGLSNKTEAVKSSYTLPKEVFPLYKSSSLHTKPIRRYPPQLFLMVGLLLLLSAFAVRMATKLYFKDDPTVEAAVKPATESKTAEPEPKPAQFDYNPKLPNIPESAPAFADLAKPVSFPRLSGCVVNRAHPETCRCYTQQGTPYFVSPDMCMSYIDYGRFDPYRADTAGASPQGDHRGRSARAAAPLSPTADVEQATETDVAG